MLCGGCADCCVAGVVVVCVLCVPLPVVMIVELVSWFYLVVIRDGSTGWPPSKYHMTQCTSHSRQGTKLGERSRCNEPG